MERNGQREGKVCVCAVSFYIGGPPQGRSLVGVSSSLTVAVITPLCRHKSHLPPITEAPSNHGKSELGRLTATNVLTAAIQLNFLILWAGNTVPMRSGGLPTSGTLRSRLAVPVCRFLGMALPKCGPSKPAVLV